MVGERYTLGSCHGIMKWQFPSWERYTHAQDFGPLGHSISER
jgi:hypothetical protein